MIITKNKNLILAAILAALVVGAVAFQSNAVFSATTKIHPIKVIGTAKFVLKGEVTAVSSNTLALHISNTSKNAKAFDNKDKTLTISGKTVITKNGKNIKFSQIKAGDRVKVFGFFDKKTGNITLVRWIKVVGK